MKNSLESKLLNILTNKEFKQLSDEEKTYVLKSIAEEDYSFYKKILTKEDRIEEIAPNKSVKQNLDIALNNKHKTMVLIYKPLLAVASVIIIIAITIWSIHKNNNNVNVLCNDEMNLDKELHNAKITNVLLNLGRIENQSYKIIPPFNSKLECSTDLNSKVIF